jgi:hypothetical protein
MRLHALGLSAIHRASKPPATRKPQTVDPVPGFILAKTHFG